ncbi:hypothetical protein CPB83DRAFT_832429 [Crepidotus variabilis]|uniref:Uncharacterized protein n=1 Tax=Crepidotus variabilis TaxID=179855 RepID=A0A9P6EPB7_9AGAR|nr:hypothetical protein CPB83DRAFT_832429 [Crepidotus variabilis]
MAHLPGRYLNAASTYFVIALQKIRTVYQPLSSSVTRSHWIDTTASTPPVLDVSIRHLNIAQLQYLQVARSECLNCCFGARLQGSHIANRDVAPSGDKRHISSSPKTNYPNGVYTFPKLHRPTFFSIIAIREVPIPNQCNSIQFSMFIFGCTHGSLESSATWNTQLCNKAQRRYRFGHGGVLEVLS